MKTSRGLMASVVLIVVAVAAAAWLYPHLPAQVPTHWDVHDHVDGTMPRLWAAAFPALALLAVLALSVLAPAISPRQFSIKRFASVWWVLALTTEAYVLIIGFAVLLKAAGYAAPIPRIAMLAVGVLLLVCGNYTGRLQKNFFIGIRTPWTLASDAVWERTHRFGGWVFVAGGVGTLIAAVVDPAPWLILAVLVAVFLITVGYSYYMHLCLEGSR
ncbi:MAG TPA: SdpI family protein [Rhodanobacteraceae bacterium]